MLGDLHVTPCMVNITRSRLCILTNKRFYKVTHLLQSQGGRTISWTQLLAVQDVDTCKVCLDSLASVCCCSPFRTLWFLYSTRRDECVRLVICCRAEMVVFLNYRSHVAACDLLSSS